MPDTGLQQLLDGMSQDKGVKGQVWDAYHATTDPATFQKSLDSTPFSRQQKAQIWDHWQANVRSGPLDKLTQGAADSAVGAGQGLFDYAYNRGLSGMASDLGSSIKSGWDATMQYAHDFFTDPHQTLPTAGAVIGAANPDYPIFGAGTGAAIGENTAQMYDMMQAIRQGKPYTKSPESATLDTALAFGGGAAGEAIPRIPLMRPLQNETGQLVEKLYGKAALPHQMTQSPTLDFLYNIAKGMTGRSRMEATEAAQQGIEKRAVDTMAGQIHPSAGLPTDIQGQNIRNAAATAFDQAQQPVQAAYKNFFQSTKGIYETTIDPITGQKIKGASLLDLHEARSRALEAGRDALDAQDAKSAYEANKQADNYLARMQKIMPPQVAQAYDTLSGTYRKVMDTYDNPIMRKLRRGVHPEQLADTILNPESGLPKTTPLGGKVSQSIPDMLSRVQDAVPPDTWQNLQATVLQRLYENSLKLKGTNATVAELDAASMKRQLDRMGPGAFQALFGTSGGGTPSATGQGIKDFVEAVAQASRKPSATGKFFIDLRQAAAVSAVAGASVGYATGDTEKGTEAAVVPGMVYLVAPWALARLMTNPTTRNLFYRGLAETNPTVKAQIAEGLVKLVSKGVTSTAATLGKDTPQNQGAANVGQPAQQ